MPTQDAGCKSKYRITRVSVGVLRGKLMEGSVDCYENYAYKLAMVE